MKKYLKYVIVFLFSAGIGLAAMGLAHTMREQPLSWLYVSPKAAADYKTAITTEEKNMEQLDLLIADAERKLKEYQDLANQIQSSGLETRMLEELDYYKAAAGAVDMEGQGVIVTVDDAARDLGDNGYISNDLFIHDNDLLMLINELNAAGAEIVSVKGQRVGNISSIACAGYTVEINGQKFARPFEIRAIGDAKRMAAALLSPGSYAMAMKADGPLVNVEVKDKLKISAYPDDQTFVYMTKVKEEETN